MKKVSFINNNNLAVLRSTLVMFFFLISVNSIVVAQQSAYEKSELTQLPQHSDLENLSMGMVPSVYVKNGQLELTEVQVSPIRIIASLQSISDFYNADPILDNVEIIVIQINDINDLDYRILADSLNHLTNLKYIYLSSSVELCGVPGSNTTCEKETINSLINGDFASGATLLYTTELSE